MSKELRIIFMGTPSFAVEILKGMVQAGENIVAVITAPDKPAGRGRKLNESNVKKYAVEQNLNLLQPTNLKDPKFLEELQSLNANLQVVVAFRMLPKVVWEMPKYGTFNLHASLLPQYRGAAPINWAIVNQEKKTGVTTFFIDEKIDTGEIILNREIEISKSDTAGSLHDNLMNLGRELVLETIELIKQGDIKTKAQSGQDKLKMAPKLTPENTRIEWENSGEVIDAFIRGLSPYPGAWTLLQNNDTELKTKIYAGSFEFEDHKETIGSITASKKELKVAVNEGYISILEMQLPGKRNMKVSSLLNGYSFDSNAKVL